MDTPKKELNIEISPDIAQGVYTNLAIITHSHSEFIMDYVQLMPGAPKPKVLSRVIMAPEHAKRLLKALQDNISKYEQEHGEIKLPNIPHPVVPPLGFTGEA
ncbi:MAG: DUF3467 domain-containing protein [Bacteroidales bacterium]|jgi:hypothetical protein|nr:DUF3467 domain-containing protein [Bacteroidales bacterium]MBR5671072.1 DUF3467 domain-containing protein [Bacteroidales bacterium]